VVEVLARIEAAQNNLACLHRWVSERFDRR
jgi:hypothetical protein